MVHVRRSLNSCDQGHLTGPTIDGDLPGVADFVGCPGDAGWIGHARYRRVARSADLGLIIQRPGAVSKLNEFRLEVDWVTRGSVASNILDRWMLGKGVKAQACDSPSLSQVATSEQPPRPS